jgi:hypothetical protein
MKIMQSLASWKSFHRNNLTSIKQLNLNLNGTGLHRNVKNGEKTYEENDSFSIRIL